MSALQPGVAAACAVLLACAGCSRGRAPAHPMGPVEVGVVTIDPSPVTLTAELPGRVCAYRVAEVRARVNGIVLKRLFAEGLVEATLQAARLRLRPIVMTSLAFGFGVLPLAIASGAGAGAMKAIGTSVLGGMITATFLAIFFIPLFFVLLVEASGRRRSRARLETVAEPGRVSGGK